MPPKWEKERQKLPGCQRMAAKATQVVSVSIGEKLALLILIESYFSITGSTTALQDGSPLQSCLF